MMAQTTNNYGERLYEDLHIYCQDRSETIWFTADIIILITGVLTNVPLLCLFFRDRKNLSASKVLGVNLVIMDLIYLSILPVTLINESLRENITYAALSDVVKEKRNQSNTVLEDGNNAFDMLALVGCPLLLTCMCVERYLAVCRPLIYINTRRTEYRMIVSAAVWTITALFSVLTYFIQNMMKMMLSIFIIISGLFIAMLICLRGVVFSLWQQSPAHSSFGTHTESPVKRRAVLNLLVVVGCAVVFYLPVLAMVPLLICTSFNCEDGLTDDNMCDVFALSMLFPSFSVLIGPMFFLSKAKQMFCLKEAGNIVSKR